MAEVTEAAVEAAMAEFAKSWPNFAAHAPISTRSVFRKALAVGLAEASPLEGFPLTDAEKGLLRETLWHAVQRGDVPDEERAKMHELRARLADSIVPS